MPPETSDWEISADLLGKKRQGIKGKGGGKWRRKKENCRKIVKREVKNCLEGGKFTK